jgi:hypothetical protein
MTVHGRPREVLAIRRAARIRPRRGPGRRRGGIVQLRRHRPLPRKPRFGAHFPTLRPCMDVCGLVDATGEEPEEWMGRRGVIITTMALEGRPSSIPHFGPCSPSGPRWPRSPSPYYSSKWAPWAPRSWQRAHLRPLAQEDRYEVGLRPGTGWPIGPSNPVNRPNPASSPNHLWHLEALLPPTPTLASYRPPRSRAG